MSRTHVLESVTVNLGVEVDGVLAGDNVGESRSGLALGGVLSTGHFNEAVDGHTKDTENGGQRRLLCVGTMDEPG